MSHHSSGSGGGGPALGVFLAADAAQFLQELAYSLGAEVVSAFGWPQALVVEDLRDGWGGVAGLGGLVGAGCQMRKVAELVQAADGADDLASGTVPACPGDLHGEALPEAPGSAVTPRQVRQPLKVNAITEIWPRQTSALTHQCDGPNVAPRSRQLVHLPLVLGREPTPQRIVHPDIESLGSTACLTIFPQVRQLPYQTPLPGQNAL